MKKVVIVLLSVVWMLSIVGCGKQYVHPTKSKSERFQDQLECEELVQGRVVQDGHGFEDGYDSVRLIRRCMEGKGWAYK